MHAPTVCRCRCYGCKGAGCTFHWGPRLRVSQFFRDIRDRW